MTEQLSTQIIFARLNESDSEDSERRSSQDGLFLSGHLLNLVSPYWARPLTSLTITCVSFYLLSSFPRALGSVKGLTIVLTGLVYY